MLGASEVGKTTLTSQFMSSNDVGGYIRESMDDGEYLQHAISVETFEMQQQMIFICFFTQKKNTAKSASMSS